MVAQQTGIGHHSPFAASKSSCRSGSAAAGSPVFNRIPPPPSYPPPWSPDTMPPPAPPSSRCKKPPPPPPTAPCAALLAADCCCCCCCCCCCLLLVYDLLVEAAAAAAAASVVVRLLAAALLLLLLLLRLPDRPPGWRLHSKPKRRQHRCLVVTRFRLCAGAHSQRSSLLGGLNCCWLHQACDVPAHCDRSTSCHDNMHAQTALLPSFIYVKTTQKPQPSAPPPTMLTCTRPPAEPPP